MAGTAAQEPAEDPPRTGDRPGRQAAAALAAGLAIIFLVRCLTVSSRLDMGGDIATYLSTMNSFFGQDATGFGLDRPPLIALPLKLATLLMGDLFAVKTLGLLFSVALAVPFYLLARRVCRPWIAAAAALLFVLTPIYSDMLTWGYITMAGLFFGLLTIHFLLSLLDRPSRANVFLTGLCASLIVGFHQLSLAYFVPLFLLMAAALLAFHRPAALRHAGAVAAAVAFALILSLPYLPLYIKMLGLQAPAGPDSSLGLAASSWPWIVGPVLSLPALVLAIRWTAEKHRTTAIATAVMLAYSLALMVFRLPPPFVELNRRAHYFFCPAAWLLGAVLVSQAWEWGRARLPAANGRVLRAAAGASLAALLVVMMVLSQAKLRSGLDFFGYLDDARWGAVGWLRANSPPRAGVAAYPETLGWWIEAEAGRNTAAVTDRDTVPYVFLQERSLAAERMLSRNQGLENGLLRLATTLPYRGAPGQPVLGASAGGSYHDILMFDDREVLLEVQGGQAAFLSDSPEAHFAVTGDASSMTMTTAYRASGATVVQDARLDRGSGTAVVAYDVQAGSAYPERLSVPVLFALEPASVTIAPDRRSIEVEQYLRGQADRVCTRIDIETTGALVASATLAEGRLALSFDIQEARSTVVFSLSVTEPASEGDADVLHYQVPGILLDPGLEHMASVDYLAVDLRPNPHLAGPVPRGAEEWLDACPYYRLVYSEGDIRIYEVVASALA